MSHRWARSAMTVAAAIVAATTLSACSPDRAEPGTKVFSRSVIEGSRSTIELPTGSLRLVVSKPRDELTDREAEPRRAPDGGGSFVGLSWDLRPRERTASSAHTLRRLPLAAAVTLISGGKRYPIGKPYDAAHKVGEKTRSSSWWVAVDGDGDRPTIEVAYGGEAQVVDVAKRHIEPGPAAPLYSPPPVAPVATQCGAAKQSGPPSPPEYDAFTCDVDVLGLEPYVDEVGWAKPGRTWAILSVSSRLLGPIAWRTASGRIEYEGVNVFVWAVSVDGRKASMIIDNSHGKDGRSSAIVAVDIPVDGSAELELLVSYRSGRATSQRPADAPPTVGVSIPTRKIRLDY